MAKRNKKPAVSGRKSKGWLAWVLGSADSFDGYFKQSRSLALSFVLIAPLLVIYEIALVRRWGTPSGAGGYVREVLADLLRTSPGMVLNLLIFILLLVAIFVLARQRGLRLNLILPMVLESAGWAVVLVGLAVLICQRLPASLSLPALDTGGGGGGTRAIQNIVASIGAGVYEEILFRLCLTSLLYLIGLELFDGRTGRAAVFAVSLGALAFALCHDTKPDVYLLFYFASGVFFSVVYMYRGLGVAVYTHVIYDIIAYLSLR